MNAERIKEIQEQTAYPESVSVMIALKQVWNECEQEYKEKMKEESSNKISLPSIRDMYDFASGTYTMSSQEHLRTAFVEGAKWCLEQQTSLQNVK